MESEFDCKYNNMEEELNNAKGKLEILNERIRRIVGRSPYSASRTDKSRTRPDTRQELRTIEISKFRRRSQDSKSVFERLSSPTLRLAEKPRLNSRVIRELPTRQEIVEAQGNDLESKARNRRMFGSLLGTLHKFCQEETRLKQKADKKAQIEKRVEEQEMLERATLRREKESLFLDRKNKQQQIETLELKIGYLNDFKTWKASVMPLKLYTRTKTKPHIYYRPRVLCKKTEALLQESHNYVRSLMKDKQIQLNKIITDLENNMKPTNIEIHYDDRKNYVDPIDITKTEINSSYRGSLENSDLTDEPLKCSEKDVLEFKENNLENINQSMLCTLQKSLR